MGRLVILVGVMSLCLLLAAPASAQQVKNAAVSRIEPGRATIVIKTDIPSDVSIDYGTSPGSYTMNATSDGLARHEAALTGLPPSTRIYYRVAITDSSNPANTQVYPEKSFSSHKESGRPFRYTVVGDNRPAPNNPILPTAAWLTIIAQMTGAGPDLALHAGDIIMAQAGDSAAQNEEKYDAYFNVTSGLTWSAPFYMAAGNHERLFEPVGLSGYKREFTLPENNGLDAATNGELYYSFDHGDTHFIILCTEIPGQYGLVTGNQKLWLEADLAANSRPWTAVVLHQPLFGHSGSLSHSADPWANPDNVAGQQNRAEIIALFEQNGVDIVFHGHDHYYKRHSENGIQYVVTGGGGSPLYALPPMAPGDIFSSRDFHHVQVDEDAASMTVTAIDTGGAVLESFTIGSPALGLANSRTYWASYPDYESRELSVDYMLDNRGAGDALSVAIVNTQSSNGVFTVTPLPLPVGDLSVTETKPLTMKYLVPFGVAFFRTTSFASCEGLDGVLYNFPGPPPGV